MSPEATILSVALHAILFVQLIRITAHCCEHSHRDNADRQGGILFNHDWSNAA